MKSTRLLILLMLMTALAAPIFANINGAIFTTESQCDGTNVNLFNSKEAVYLDGGPRKPGAAGLPDGYYYIQVTSPNGQLLGISPTAAVHVTNGEFDTCYQLWSILIKASDGSMGYDTTPNNGGVYKVWATPEAYFSPGDGTNGFINAWCKTDNFKVKTDAVCVPSTISVRKFHDSNANGIQDANEPDLEWLIDITDPAGSPNTYLSPLTVLTTLTGTWQICEQYDSRWIQIALFVDSAAMPVSLCAGVTVSAGCDEVHEVVFGNIQAGSITACTFNDENVNGIRDIGELPVEGVRFVLSGTNIRGESVDLIAYTGADGCVSFTGLLPGSYELCEVVPINWTATTDECRQITLEEGQDISFDFGNFCGGFADFNTKGYWHNKNGLDETEDADIAYINTLAPWLACSTNTQPFGPINGKYCSGSNVPAAKVGGAIIAPAGTPKAEQSIFLVYKNSIVKLQLAQQLYAFILNVRHRLTECGPDSWILLSDGTWKQASVLISEALAKWASGTNAERSAITKELDWLNNSMVAYRSCTPCEIVYPLP